MSIRVVLSRSLTIVAAIVLFAAAPRAQSALNAPTNVTVSNVNTRLVGSTTLSSSSRLSVAWAAPSGYVVDHYEIRALEAGLLTQVTAPASSTSVTLTGLKASTTYSVTVKSCQDSGCARYGEASAISGTTSAEYWQVQGTGGSASTSTFVVPSLSPGNVMAWPFVYGSEAGHLQGKVRFYFKGGSPSFNTAVALSTGTATANPASVSSFTQDPNYGLRNPTPGATFINRDVSGPQGVPRWTGGIRMFFKVSGADNKSRVFYLDSQDGLAGQDFHPGSPTSVSATADWEVGGAAAPTLIIGVTGDAARGDSGLMQARQFKIGVPLLTHWLWDEAPGTFMVITGQDDCGQTIDGLFYVQWDGTRWNVTKGVNNCARPLVKYGHGPVLLHRGGTRFKLYYEDRLIDSGQVNKPLRLLYGDGAFSGASSLAFEDWETQATAREVHFLWPDGSLVAVGDESGFGDHVIYYPTADQDVQFMYMNLTGLDGTAAAPSSGIGMAVLINP